MNTRERVLKEALNCVNGEREKQYGSPEDNFSRIADLWSVYLTSLFEDEKIVVDIDPIDVAKMMILFKIARSNGDKDKLDNYVDMIGYGACAAEIFENSTSLLDIYNSILSDILSFSTSVNVDPFDIVGRLTLNGHAPTEMAELVLTGRLKMDSVVHYIEDAIHEVKEKNKGVSK
jgi:hypothetical protein